MSAANETFLLEFIENKGSVQFFQIKSNQLMIRLYHTHLRFSPLDLPSAFARNSDNFENKVGLLTNNPQFIEQFFE